MGPDGLVFPERPSGAFVADAALLEDVDAVGQVEAKVHVLLGEEDGQAVALEAADLLEAAAKDYDSLTERCRAFDEDLVGISPDYEVRVASRLLAVLRRAGGRLRIEVEPVAERPDLYPMAVTVEADGRRVGEFVIAGGAGSDASGGGASTSGSSVRQVVTLDLPAVGDPAGSPAGVPASDAAAIDVKLVPARSGWMDVDGRWTEVSFRLISMACVSG